MITKSCHGKHVLNLMVYIIVRNVIPLAVLLIYYVNSNMVPLYM